MPFFQSLKRDERRRRVLAEDRPAAEEASAPAPSKSRGRKIVVYPQSARMENQRRVTDLVPKSYLTIGLLFLAGLTAITGLAAGHVWLSDLEQWLSKEGTAALALGGRGNLASWFSSVVLGLASLVSLVVFSIRRHKLDDYRGRYRWWMAAAAVWLVMSIDATAGIHEPFSIVVGRLSGYQATTSGAMWWIGCWGLLLGALSLRLIFDMRHSRLACGAYLLALAAWGGGAAVELTGFQLPNISTALLAGTCKLLGQLLLLLGLGLYARHVILHAQGLLPVRGKAKKEKAKKEAKPAAKTDATTIIDRRTDLHSGSAPAPHANLAASTAESDDDYDDSDVDDDDSSGRNRKLTKAERKRLRKQKSEQRGW